MGGGSRRSHALSLSFSLGGSWLNFEVWLGCRVPLYEFCYIYKYWGRGLTLRFFLFFFIFYFVETRYLSNCVLLVKLGAHFERCVPLLELGTLFELCVPLFELGALFELCVPLFELCVPLFELWGPFRSVRSPFRTVGSPFRKRRGVLHLFERGPTSRTGRGGWNPN